ncbi:MAG: hypothetical protein AB7I19_16140 [Planctomycetota bacterium]
MTDPLPDPLDERIDAGLRAAFAAPAVTTFVNIANAATRSSTSRRRFVATAAAAAVFLFVIYLATRPTIVGPEGHDGRQLGALWVAAYAHATTTEEIGACCDPGSDLASLCQERFSQQVRFRDGDVAKLCGCYRGLSTGGSVAVLLRRDRQVIGVFVLLATQDPGAKLPLDSDLSMTRRRLGPFALYAIAEAPVDDVLAAFSLPTP